MFRIFGKGTVYSCLNLSAMGIWLYKNRLSEGLEQINSNTTYDHQAFCQYQ